MADFDPVPLTRRIPRDAFEQQLFREYLQDKLSSGSWAMQRADGRLIASLGEYQGDGTWQLFIRTDFTYREVAEGEIDLGGFTPRPIVSEREEALKQIWGDTLPGDLLDDPFLVGRCWVGEREYPVTEAYRVQGEWEFPRQSWQIPDGDKGHPERYGTDSNYLEYPPVVGWDFSHLY